MLNKNNKLYDNSIYTKEENVWKAYGFCVSLRVILGICVILGIIGNRTILILAIMIVYIFQGILRKKGQSSWKSYWKPIISYSTISVLNSYALYSCIKKNNNCSDLMSKIATVSGGLIIADAIAGLESRILVDKITN